MKGIILAGGSGTRLYPITYAISKQIMPIYDKPMIYYPLSVLMMAGIRDILIISSPQDIGGFKRLLGDGRQFGCSFSYKEQQAPKGIAEAFLIGEDFIGDDPVALILGDNFIYRDGLMKDLKKCTNPQGAMIFAYHVSDPEKYGIVEFDENFKAVSLEEKPKQPKSNYAIPGIYFYDNSVVDVAKRISPSARGELEITDVNKEYLKQDRLKVIVLGRGATWIDTGSFESLMDASQFVELVEKRQGLKIGCVEEVAYRLGFIGKEQLKKLAEAQMDSGYGKYLMSLDSIKHEG